MHVFRLTKVSQCSSRLIASTAADDFILFATLNACVLCIFSSYKEWTVDCMHSGLQKRFSTPPLRRCCTFLHERAGNEEAEGAQEQGGHVQLGHEPGGRLLGMVWQALVPPHRTYFYLVIRFFMLFLSQAQCPAHVVQKT